ncbi:MAG TPA: MtrB/PioB family decaheme-associated outer membrane protein [Aromatoleum sp.]|uniref:MtrB/PioB family decaheme-associated outer membrane protein n=1 Tax=Aromatoleum sp. TaxID=2307007 RepID=UPI002B475D15|nr:MtrB/PioB family decaheme-associated outer membrane protein [Aromatoleum sp.]HJV26358.1 MtrB/PioB family decaheme-associated outer membrane protein [Aromatoleum sp.]
MKNRAIDTTLRLSAVAAALAAVFPLQSMAADEVDDMTMLTRPESSVRLGVGYVDQDNHNFGQYRALQDSGLYGLVDMDIVRRDDATGTWYKLRGRNLGLDTRELGLVYGPQGNWKLSLDYREIPRYSQYTINTGLQGIGSNNLNVSSANKRDVILDTKREKIALGFEKNLGENWSTTFRFTNEEKDGARLWGRGTSFGAGAANRWFNFLAEPIDSRITTWEAKIAFTDAKLQLAGGYYGSQYSNHNTALNITGGGAGFNTIAPGVVPLNPMALPPSNQAHQFYVDGGYNFTDTTRASFKLAQTIATQNDDFIDNPPGVVDTVTTGNISGRTRLGGHVDTTLAFVGLSTRPTPKLSLIANLRYEDRDDKTPSFKYIDAPVSAISHDGTNEVRSYQTQQGKVEANYLLGSGYRLVAGFEDEEKKRNTSAVRVVSHRESTDEASWKLELRRAMSETLNGAVAYIHSDRNGSDFLVNRFLNGAVSRNFIAPIHLADRDREKVRLSADWTPVESLNLQVVAEDTRDDYAARIDLGLGARKGSSTLYSLDATYSLDESSKLNAWATRADTRSKQATAAGATPVPAAGQTELTVAQLATLNIWTAALRNRTDAFGIGGDAKVSEKLQVGATLEFSYDKAEYLLANEQGTTGARDLPDIKYRTTTLRLFSQYALRKNAGLRFDYIYDRRLADDWTWKTWQYLSNTAAGDGTTIRQDPSQTVNFVGVSAYYKWW